MDFRTFLGTNALNRSCAAMAAAVALSGLTFLAPRATYAGGPDPIEMEPSAPVQDGRFGWDFRYSIVIRKPSGEPRVTIHYQTPGDAPLAEQTARLYTRLMRLHLNHFGTEARFFQDADTADVWLAAQRPSTANDGGETRQNQMYIFGIHDVRRSNLEWTRTQVHEWGHLTLPAARGFTDPENDASGYLGERLYMKWLHDDVPSEAGSGGSAVPPGDGTSRAELNLYYTRQVAPLMARFNRSEPDGGGPNAPVLSERNTTAMDGYIGAVCACDRAWGSPLTGRALFSILGTKPQDFFIASRSVWTNALQRSDSVPLKLPAWIPLTRGAYRFTTGAGGNQNDFRAAANPLALVSRNRGRDYRAHRQAVSQTLPSSAPLSAPFTATGSAPCKINLTLDVFAPRPDGFHDLASLVVPMAYPNDTVTVSVRHGESDTPTQISLTCDDPTLPTDEKNLAFRAARDFADAFLPPTGLQIHVNLIKRLPHQAGLGGGSSDAATVLRLLKRHHFGRDYNPFHGRTLREIGCGLGSDVPLFFPGGPIWMQGRGETITPLGFSLPPLFGVLVKPSVGVPTGPAFALLDRLPARTKEKDNLNYGHSASLKMKMALYQWQVGGADELGPLLHNDFEAAVLPAFYQVARAHQSVQDAGAVRALLCGSGSAVFGLARDRDHARELVSALQNRFPYVAETSTLARDDSTEELEDRTDG